MELKNYTNELGKLIPRYHKENELAKHHKKLADADNKQIKKIMMEADFDEYSVDGLQAVITISERVDLMEDVLIGKLKELGVEGVIKTREYVDMDALESALYHGEVNPALLAQAQTKKEVVTLRIKQVEEG